MPEIPDADLLHTLRQLRPHSQPPAWPAYTPALQALLAKPLSAAALALRLELIQELWRLAALEPAQAHLQAVLAYLRKEPYALNAQEHSRVWLRQGMVLLRLGQLSDALPCLYDALEMSDDGYAALQLGNALRYLGEYDEASGHLTRAFNKAKAERDGTLAIAALNAQGELALDQGQGQNAVEAFGQALGITEFDRDESPSILPLAGIAHGQALWGYPHKGLSVVHKAWQRLPQQPDPALSARVRLAWAHVHQANGDNDSALQQLQQAAADAERAPHQPLYLRIVVMQLRLASSADPARLEPAQKLAKSMQMRPEQQQLATLARLG